jgi:hypothetical protein
VHAGDLTDVSRAMRAHLEALRVLVGDAVAVAEADDPDPGDRFRGLYVTADQLAPGLGPGGSPMFSAGTSLDIEDRGPGDRLSALRRTLGLEPLDLAILLVAVAPDLDPTFERAYGYLHDDITRRRASVGLALAVAGIDGADGAGRARLLPGSLLLGRRLVLVEDGDRPMLTRSLRVPDRVTAHLLGHDQSDPVVERLAVASEPAEGVDGRFERALAAGARIAVVPAPIGSAALGTAVAELAAAGLGAVCLDLDRLDPDDDVGDIAAIAAREASLTGSGLVVQPLDVLAAKGAAVVRAVAESGPPVVFVGRATWEPGWSRLAPVVLEPVATVTTLAPGLAHRLSPEQAARAREVASLQAAAADVEVDLEHLAAGARAGNGAVLERLARRIPPRATWERLIAPATVVDRLRELCARVRWRDQVLGEWDMGGSASKGRAVTGLFAGESGTGKTLAAEVIAADLGLDMYVVDLSTVVDKYIGETEKNLDKVFNEADQINAVLLFDEADAIFGKRSEVSDARDRYANVEVAYLLQRMERFDGVALLTTNLRANLDEAFLRRLDVVVEFPDPDEDARRQLWQVHLPSSLPFDDDVDFDFLTEAFDLTGGSIRNVALTAAFLAADNDRPVSMADLVRATEREYRKLGRLCLPSEFGHWYDAAIGGAR